MIKIFLPLTANTVAKLDKKPSAYLNVGKELVLILPHDENEKKEALFWLATQIEQEARKL